MSYSLKLIQQKIPTVVIFGRTNVGKSTLFNRMIGEEKALVSKLPGTTRDSNRGIVNWRKKSFEIIDTGGIIDLKLLLAKKYPPQDTIEAKVQKQARQMILRADLVLFLVDVKAGLLPTDRQMALFLKKYLPPRKNIILVVNKVDNPQLRKEIFDFYKLSLGEPVLISAASGSGTGDLLDIIIKKLKYGYKPPLPPLTKGALSGTFKKIPNPQFPIPNSVNVCILGKPNVGKSSLLNAILGEERMIVTPFPHTTREPQDTFISHEDKIIRLVDTAGISKKGLKVPFRKKERLEALEKLGIAKSLRALDKAQIALFVIDITEPLTHQDTKIAEEISGRKKSLIIVANKWDLIKEKNTDRFTRYIYAKLPFITWAPIQFVSALTGLKIKKIMDLILKAMEQRQKEVTQDELKEFLARLVKIHKPARGKGFRHPRIYDIKQLKSNPPVFALHIGSKEDLHFSYIRFIGNRLREKYGFWGTPITIRVVKNKKAHGKGG